MLFLLGFWSGRYGFEITEFIRNVNKRLSSFKYVSKHCLELLNILCLIPKKHFTLLMFDGPCIIVITEE